MLGHQFYVKDADDRVRGPYRLATLVSFARKGKVAATSLVSVDRLHWWRASQMPEVFPEEGLRAAPEWERLKREQRIRQLVAAIGALLVAGAVTYWRIDRMLERQQVKRERNEEMRLLSEEMGTTLKGMLETQQRWAEERERRDAKARSTPTALLQARYPRLTRLFSAFLTSRWQAEFASVDESVDAYGATLDVEGRKQARQEVARLLAEFPEDDRALYEALVVHLATDYNPCPDGDHTCRTWLTGLAQRLK